MNYLKKLTLFGMTALLLSSCAEENPWRMEEGTGALKLRLSADARVSDAVPQTRANYSLTPPEAEDFGITLSKTDGSYEKQWDSVDDFNSAKGFSVGAYTISASHGDPEKEGFDSPHFYGEASVMVLDGESSQAEITATLANTMVSLDFTDAFKTFFPDYSAQVHSEGYSYQDISKFDANRPVYLVPGNIKVALTLTQPNTGKKTTIQPAEFEAKARHHYHVVLDYNGGAVGVGQIIVRFDDSVVEEDVTIDLTDELFTAPAPEVMPVGFSDGSVIQMLEGVGPKGDLKINVDAAGRMKEANLTISSADRSFSSGSNEIDLLTASQADQNLLSEWGVDCRGFFRLPSRFAFINLANYVDRLPEGEHTLTLQVKDVMTHVSEPLTFKVNVEPVSIKVVPESAVFGAESLVLNVDYNGSSIADDLSFMVLNNSGNYVEAPVVNISEKSPTRATPSKSYLVELSIPAVDRSSGKVRTLYRGVNKVESDFSVILPKYSVTMDAYARFVDVKVQTEDPSLLASVTAALRPFVTGANSGQATLTRDLDNGVVRIANLSAASKYTIQTTLDQSHEPVFATSNELTTEPLFAVPNANFTNVLENSLDISGLQVGGEYQVWPTNYHNTSSILLSEPQGWANLNSLTAYSGSRNMNTWFVVPSTWAQDNKVYIRTVGYNHDGVTPNRSGGAFSTTYYCTNTPSDDQLEKCAGEIFLGSYRFTGTAARTDGVACTSRPTTLTFDYQYAPLGSDVAFGYVRVLASDGSVLSKAEFDIPKADAMTKVSVQLPAYPFGKKAARIQLGFRSSKGDVIGVHIPSGSELNDGGRLSNDVFPANQYHSLATGSLLVLDDVILGYTAPAFPSGKAARKVGIKKNSSRKSKKSRR
ncbi:MAG: DUF4493 domain-containing protein [Bacteroidales bacterium]|nr:DUF4493 domain-containing protein [Bacteroidales bacterium]